MAIGLIQVVGLVLAVFFLIPGDFLRGKSAAATRRCTATGNRSKRMVLLITGRLRPISFSATAAVTTGNFGSISINGRTAASLLPRPRSSRHFSCSSLTLWEKDRA